MDWISNGEIWVALLTLTTLEIVLGIDNIIFISILAGKLPPEQRDRARIVGLGAAMIMRILLLLFINVIVGLTDPIFTIVDQDVSGRDLILLGGGLFLLGKSTFEIHEKLEGHEGGGPVRAASSFASVIIQIMLLDIVFSLDSVITAVGMADDIGVMIAAVIIAIGVMLFASGPIAAFVEEHPTVKMLALSFLLLIGMSLVAEGAHQHIPKGYIYFAMAFSVLVELLNLRLRPRAEHPVQLGPLNPGFAPALAVAAAAAGTAGRGVPAASASSEVDPAGPKPAEREGQGNRGRGRQIGPGNRSRGRNRR